MKKAIVILVLACLTAGCLLVPEDESVYISPEECILLHAAWFQKKLNHERLELPFADPPPACPVPVPKY